MMVEEGGIIHIEVIEPIEFDERALLLMQAGMGEVVWLNIEEFERIFGPLK